MAAKGKSDHVSVKQVGLTEKALEKQEGASERGLCSKKMQLQVELMRCCDMFMGKLMPNAEEVVAALQSVSELTGITRQNFRAHRTSD